jgi:hypothetical protein
MLAIGCSAVVVIRHQGTLALRSEVQLARAQNDELARLTRENEQARGRQVSGADLDSLRTDHLLVERLRGELEALKKSSAASAAKPGGLVPTQKSIPAAEWRNAGRDTARDAFETALWAASNGDPATLAGTLELSTGAKTKAQALFDGLSDDVKARYGSPEQLVALLAARAINVSAMTILREQGDDEVKSLEVVLQQPAAPPRKAFFGLHRADSTWRLVVPEVAVDSYAKLLKEPGTAR